MKTYTPKLRLRPIKAIRLPKGLTADPGDYLIIEDDAVRVMPATKFEQLYTAARPPRKSRGETTQKEVIFTTLSSCPTPVTQRELRALLPPDCRTNMTARLSDLCREKRVRRIPTSQGAGRYEVAR